MVAVAGIDWLEAERVAGRYVATFSRPHDDRFIILHAHRENR
jgi:hypothetical protein